MTMTILIAAVFGIWFVLSVINQISGGRYIWFIQRRDIFRLLPNWGFFTADLTALDMHLLIRDKHTGRHELIVPSVDMGERQGKIRFLYPYRRLGVTLFKAQFYLSSLARSAQNNGETLPVERTIPYLMLLRYSMVQEKAPSVEQRQFLIAVNRRKDGEASLEPFMISSFHAVRKVERPNVAAASPSQAKTLVSS